MLHYKNILSLSLLGSCALSALSVPAFAQELEAGTVQHTLTDDGKVALADIIEETDIVVTASGKIGRAHV